jgi:uncharacterized membrane protein/thiol-disulfide isomerase/thioredoxin
MRKIAPVLLLRLALLVAVFACAVLLVEYENTGDPAFCGAGSGCMAVRRSAYSDIQGIPLPSIGVCASAGLLAMVLVARERAHTFFVAAVGLGGAIAAAGLIGVQALQIGAFCRWCVLVDASLIVAGLAAVLVHRAVSRSEAFERWLEALAARRVLVVAWIVGAAAAAALPFLWGEYPVVPAVPDAIAALSVPDKVTVVSFTDFQCPYCRKMYPVLRDIEDNWGDRIAVVRKMVPLPGHHGAMPAALAYECAPAAQREAMAGRLYTANEELLSREGTLGLARKLFPKSADVFMECIDAPETRAAVEKDVELFHALEAHGLPTTYIGPRVVAGFNADQARRAVAAAMEGPRPSLPVSWMIAALALLAVALVLVTLRLAPPVLDPPAGEEAPESPV